MRRDSDELSFEELMAIEGVTPLAERGRPKANGSSTRARSENGRPPRAGTNGRGARSRPGGGAKPPARAGKPAQPTRASAGNGASGHGGGKDSGPAAPARDIEAKLAALTRELDAAKSRMTSVEAELAQARGDLERIRGQRRDLSDERSRLADERSRLDDRCRRLSEAVRAHERRQDQHTSLRAVLIERGLATESEMIAALQGLLESRPNDLLDQLELASPGDVRVLLEQRVALVHKPGCDLGGACVSVVVPPERCEITGGSDIRAAFRQLATASRDAAVHAITIVGGSPAYRQQLRAFAQETSGLRLNLVSGTQRRTRKRAEADMRKSDVVVIWGASELDHSVSGVYTSGAAPILRVSHRGISRMLEHVTAWLRSGYATG